ncbi:MAG: Myxococcales trans domain protein, partial [Myxococcales bacterium]|nr:Myxococcales trans domain protein [Myxococcales bacterium]
PDADLCKEGFFVCQNGMTVCSDNTGNNVEVCNAIDDNCNGQIDEGNPGGGGTCGSSIGVCTPGTFQCQMGMLNCVGGNQGGPEMCNGLDDNCNGVVDDMPVDVGQQCGATNVGECDYGQTICVTGSLQCAGAIGPSPEKCNGLDDNCNGVTDENPVDAGQPCGSSIGACTPGVFVCTAGMLMCSGGTGPTAEVCNGIDDDCDGTVDEQVPGEGVACGAMGGCQTGMTKCIAGTMQCVGGATAGTEICNGLDDDCDGLIDEGPLCNGGVCDNGQCAAPCVMSEFPCPQGQKCDANNFCVTDPCFNVTCPNDMMGNLQTCNNGSCEALCLTQTCPANLVCRGTDGACVPDECEYLPKCSVNELCINHTCVADPCRGMTCDTGSFCRAGGCVKSCNGVECSVGQACVDGNCTPTGCPIDCLSPEVCNPDTGQCMPSLCPGIVCPATQVCNPVNGQCIPDPCQGVTCPDMQTCSMGQCGTARGNGVHVTVGGGGCAVGSNDPSLLLGVIALGLLLRRRRSMLPAVLAALISLTGCNINEYCLNCEVPGKDGGMGSGDGGMGSGDGGLQCDPMQIHPELCNHADDDCDGFVDETFDLQTDPNNCGACGIVCTKAGAQTQCVAGACTITACFPGYFDKNNDITGPYNQSDGCEYMCFQSNGGVEACDGIDNNCNGMTDEGFNLTTDVNNCGMCNHVCQFFKATPHCTAMTCGFNPATDCAPGYRDINNTQADGCEYQCSPTNGGVEACDLVDNNCNGMVDEGFNFQTDVNNCGRCGLVCQFAHATPHCTNMACGFNGATDCAPGFYDIDGKQINGCEYACTKTNGGVEICDGKDNDCNGVADDNPTDAGGACASTSPPKGACVANGVKTCSNGALICSGATQPVTETCNNIDDNCNGPIDDSVTQACYTGPNGTSGVGVCHGGNATCTAGTFGACAGQVTPTAEQCNNLDDNCNGMIDDGPGGMPITRTCYNGLPATTLNVGTCKGGTATCAFGAFGSCVGEVDPKPDVCGDNLDTDCDGLNDTQEGCLVLDAEQRIDAPGGGLGTAAGAQHSYDLVMASGGFPFGTNVYAAWSELVGTTTEVYFRSSTNGGVTWGNIINVTSSQALTSVKPMLAVAPAAMMGGSDRIIVAYQTVAGGVRDIRVQVSTDSGQTFGNPTTNLDGAGDSFHHVVAIRGLTVVVAWEKLDTTTLNRDIESRTSTDGGVTFAAEIKVNVGSGATRFAGRPQVGITGAGGVVWAWREQRAGSSRDIFAAAVATATSAPAADIRIDGDTLDQRESDFPVMIVQGTSAYLVWQDVSTVAGGGADAMFARSTNNGVSWGAERIIDDPVSEVSSSFTPTLALDPKTSVATDDVVAIAWEDRRQGTQIFTSVSVDGGATFGTPTRASNEVGAPINGTTSVPQIAAAGSGVLAVTYQNAQTGAQSHVFVATSIDSGATWTYTQAQLDTNVGPAINPRVVGSIVATKPAAVIGWVDFRTGTHVNGDIYGAVSHQ